ncbi:hypothetical protein PVIIG_06093 [Plasmodium vivax India VII]|uniref:PIR Superfamily Protein n=1 Tax=Plasmodium vivax India VII TaxID=1077284 RepID=A0A0J9S2S5_PLAVI|nr:hypothetical protein PVIIG_06093 [Plasmodium vivax India VII]
MDKEVEEKEQYQDFLNLCDKENVFITNLTTYEKNTCKKHLRNFILCNSTNRNFFHCCGNLYVWLYFEIEKYKISNDKIKKIFGLPNSTEYSGIKYTPCPYMTFNDAVNNSEDLMKLNIFNDNAGTFYSILNDSKESKDCDLKKYVYECVDIYNKTNKQYASPQECSSLPPGNTCIIINEFNSRYTSYILNKQGLTHKFPQLFSHISLNNIDGCPLEELVSHTVSEEIKQDTPTKGGVSTSLSAMFLRFGNKNNTIIASNFDKNMENELFTIIKEDSNIKDIPEKYNIGYELK